MLLGGRFFLQVLGTAGAAPVTAPHELLDLPTPTYCQQTRPHDGVVSINNRAFGLNHATVPVSTTCWISHRGWVKKPSCFDSAGALENSVKETYRRDLWRIQAPSQLLARHCITNKRERGRARIWNESAIASAHYIGDALLLAAR